MAGPLGRRSPTRPWPSRHRAGLTCQGSSRFFTMKEAATTRMRLCIHPVPHTCRMGAGRQGGAGFARAATGPECAMPGAADRRIKHAAQPACRCRAPMGPHSRLAGESQGAAHLTHRSIHQRVPGAPLAPGLQHKGKAGRLKGRSRARRNREGRHGTDKLARDAWHSEPGAKGQSSSADGPPAPWHVRRPGGEEACK